MTSFQVAPDKAMEDDEAMEVRSTCLALTFLLILYFKKSFGLE